MRDPGISLSPITGRVHVRFFAGLFATAGLVVPLRRIGEVLPCRMYHDLDMEPIPVW